VLLINGSFANKPLTGVQRHAYEMCLALGREGIPFRIVAPCPIALPEYSELNRYLVALPKSSIGKLVRWEQGDLFRYMLGHRQSILWNPSNLAIVGPFRQITTVHDLAVYQKEKWFDWRFATLYKLYTPYTLQTSKKILTVSETVKREIVSRFGVPPEKIGVTLNGCRPLEKNTPQSQVRGEPYVLILGSLDPRKNLRNVLLAWRLLPSDMKAKVKLMVVGGANWRLAYQGTGDRVEDDESIRFLGRVSDADLGRLLDGCLANVYLSRYEGFGLPVLEALVKNKLSLLADIPVFRELFSQGCRFVDPENVPKIVDELECLIRDALSRESFIDFGEEYARKYDWQESAKILAVAYERIVSGEN
jgi:glycosyltransferase involved in cell wall biosynthesis